MCYWNLDLKFKAKLKLRVWKPKNPIWPPGGHFESDISIGSFPYTKVMCHWSLDMIFKAKLTLESGSQKIQDGHQAAILRVTSLKINRLLPMATTNMHIKFEIEIPKQTWVMLRKPCRLQKDGQTDGQGESSITPPPPPPTTTTFVGRGYNNPALV